MARISWARFANSTSVRVAAIALAAVTAILVPATVSAQKTPMRLLVSNGVKAALVAVQPACEAQTATTFTAEFNTSTALRAMAAAGPFDLAFMTEEAIDALVAEKRLDAGSKTMVARTRIGAGVRQNAAALDVRTSDGVRGALLAASSVTWASDGASRPFIEKMIEKLGITTQMAGKIHTEQGSPRATARVVNGQSDIVLTLVSEIVPVPGLKPAGALPQEFQGEVSFAAGVGAASAQAATARRVLACLVAPSAGSSYSSVGLDRAAK
jgi:molybdate transport system substrate-binding protein